MATRIVPLIMCGGAGTRLWPASRQNRPKQFLPLFGQYSTFQETVRRVSDPALFARPIIVTNSQYRFLVAEELAALGMEADVLLEPERRDSGAAIVAGALFAHRRDNNCVVAALAADHVVTEPAAFAKICAAAWAAAANHIVAFGVRPTRPATEYGYIRPGPSIGSDIFAIAQFIEKPDAATAKRHVAEGYLWNSGNFLFGVDRLLSEYRAFEPNSAAAIEHSVENAGRDLGFVTLEPTAFAAAAAKSIDYAVMERTRHAAVVPVSYGWSDIGSWQAVWELSPQDSSQNAAHGSAHFVDAKGCYVASEKQLIALHGLNNIVVVATPDAVLVAQRDNPDGLRRMVAELKDVAPAITQDHLRVHRPWGSYQPVDQGDRFQVKRIVVKRGGRLSLQMHHHRAEHWVVVRGTARITIGDDIKLLHENESIYVPSGARHRLENPGKIDLELIEVQTGSYLGEDDIVRFEDDYHRG